ncbi:MAG TPA: hypothetical protein VEG27_07110 [Usitatibacter sp.]|nr:hypothetical protein [Usitatibacter sp.]
MRPLPVLALVLAAALPAAVPAEQPEVTRHVATAPGKGAVVQTVKATATVEAVDPATRTVTLKLPHGKTRSFVAGDEVRNFDQIKVGDKVHVKYAEALTLELKKGGKEIVGTKEGAAIERAEPGEKPGGVAAHQITATVEVVGVDRKHMIVSVKNDKGEIVDLHLHDPAQVKLVEKGDHVEVTYTEALAVSLEPAAPAKKAPAKKKE